ncbi:MAG: iron-sulfur cluster assembly protein [Candidatus Sumerlaeota bacterium]|nr:iron-sulfur cluster assembly protein [Candidatus Sumerlaeota bacterium]
MSETSNQSHPPLDAAAREQMRQAIIQNLRTIYDIEIPINIYDLGLIYNVDVKPTGEVAIDMTLTAPNCPEADTLLAMVRERARAVPGVTSVDVTLVWDPPWTMESLSEAARLELGL